MFARIFNVIGHDDPNGHLIPDILNQLKIENGQVQVSTVKLGNTEPKRDYTHADDTAGGIVAILEHFEWGRPVEAFNLSRGEEHSVVDLLRIIGDYFGCMLEIEHDPGRVRRVDRNHLLGDSRKSRSALGWSARIGIDEALHDILSRLVPVRT